MSAWDDTIRRRDQAYRATVNLQHPMGAGRLVRRERFSWPGGYALALVLHNGGQLCPTCCAAEWARIASAHRHKSDDGWRPAGLAVHEAPEFDEHCDHCGTLIAEAPR